MSSRVRQLVKQRRIIRGRSIEEFGRWHVYGVSDRAIIRARLAVGERGRLWHPGDDAGRGGAFARYEWSFGDTNPPVHAWAGWQVYQLDRARTGTGDRDFLTKVYRSTTLTAMWWLNQKDASNRGVFGGGFLGMDNIGVFDRDHSLPTGGTLAQVDGTAWMAARMGRRSGLAKRPLRASGCTGRGQAACTIAASASAEAGRAVRGSSRG